jgi:hypothetical protein
VSAGTWAHHVATEYRSATVVAELLHWLLALGASPDTIARCHRIVADELRHAEMSWELQNLAGGAGPAPVPAEWTRIPHAPDADLLHRTLATLVCEYALSETIATALFRRLKRQALRPEVATVIARIVWGTMPAAEYRAVVWRTLGRVVAPRLSALGIDVSWLRRHLGDPRSARARA